jgi:hypothetical protein
MLAQGSAMSCNRLLENVTPAIGSAWNFNDLRPPLVTSGCNNDMRAFGDAPKPNLHRQISQRPRAMRESQKSKVLLHSN